MKVDENERQIEVRKLREIAKLSSIYYKNLKNFERNPNLSHVVHAVMNFSQFVCVLLIEIFHLVHHAINHKMRENDPNVPELLEGKNPIFYVYPICMIISLIMAILWLTFRTFQPIIEMTLAGCAIGILLMLAAGIIEMRHAELYINLEEISDDELMEHPIFIHNFFMCIISNLAMLVYLIHFWILYDCWQWRKKERDLENSSSSSESREDSEIFPMPETSGKSKFEISSDLDTFPTWEMLKTRLSEVDKMDLENEPVNLYCCCFDHWRYIKDRKKRVPIHEFQVVHVK